jgi:hypothetical protein
VARDFPSSNVNCFAGPASTSFAPATAKTPHRVVSTDRPVSGLSTRVRPTISPSDPPAGSLTVAHGNGRGARICRPSSPAWRSVQPDRTAFWIHTARPSPPAGQALAPVPSCETRPARLTA